MTDRRAVPRYPLSLEILVSAPAFGHGSIYDGQTRDLSTRGVYFVLEGALSPGDAIEVTITLPLSAEIKFLFRASARVSRVHRRQEGDFGMAAVIERYEIIGARNNVAECRARIPH
jgi:PilZ domain